MAQLRKSNNNTHTNSTIYKKGVFISTSKIIAIEKNVSGKQSKDIDFTLHVVSNNKIEKRIYLSGNLYKNGDIPIHLSYLLIALGIENETEQEQEQLVNDFATSDITKRLVDFILGKNIRTLSYVSGTYTNASGVESPSYKTWNMSGEGFSFPNLWDLVNTTDEEVIKAFEDKCSGAYPVKYTPEVLEEHNTDSKDNTEQTDSKDSGWEEDFI